MVRDLFDGPALARRFSSLLLVTGVAPVLAPLAGAGVLRVAGWRAIFVLLGIVSALLMLTAARALPESLAAQHRQTTATRSVLRKYRSLASDRVLMGYTAVSSLVFAAHLRQLLSLGKLVLRLVCSQASTSALSSFAASRNWVSASGPRMSNRGGPGSWTAVMIARAALTGSPGW
jgi:predicted MFS family arabinose efflux permease